MSTNDVPGANPRNGDELAMGCWAEHTDGSLIFVESTEANRVIYSMFDLSKDPIVEYRDAMPEASFKKTFSYDPTAKTRSTEKWVWHDKTPFPWDRIIKHFPDGSRLASADGMMTAAERVAESLRIRGANIARDRFKHRADEEVPKPQASDAFSVILDKVGRALKELQR
jgi:hypothetical protein